MPSGSTTRRGVIGPETFPSEGKTFTTPCPPEKYSPVQWSDPLRVLHHRSVALPIQLSLSAALAKPPRGQVIPCAEYLPKWLCMLPPVIEGENYNRGWQTTCTARCAVDKIGALCRAKFGRGLSNNRGRGLLQNHPSPNVVRDASNSVPTGAQESMFSVGTASNKNGVCNIIIIATERNEFEFPLSVSWGNI